MVFELEKVIKQNKYSDNPNYFIERCKIFGTVHPQIVFEGTVKAQKYSIKIFQGKKLIFNNTGNNTKNYTFSQIDTTKYKHCGFDYKVKLPLVSKKIDFQIICNNEIIYEKIFQNNIFITILIKIKNILKLSVKAIKLLWKKHHFLVPPKMFPYYFRKLKEKAEFSDANFQFLNPFIPEQYNEWLLENENYDEVKSLNYNPLISIVTPVYNVPAQYLEECFKSVLNQSYTNWEFCLADDCSTDPKVKQILKKYENLDKRIKVVYRKENGHISKATNSALALAKGEFVGLMDNDDMLTKDALYEVAKALNKNKSIDLIYSDEDKINSKKQRCEPYFKSDWSPDTLLSNNYLCHFVVMRKSILDKIGGERSEYDGAQDFDLFLRFTENAKIIYHIPKILYHWRIIPGSTSDNISAKTYALEAGKHSIEQALKRRKIKGKVVSNGEGTYIINYEINNPLISIIIPIRDNVEILDNCLKSIYNKTTYKNYEIIIVDNGSVENKTKKLLDKYKKQHKNIKVIRLDCDFNYSYINNQAVKSSKGEYILLLNNDTEIITGDFLEKMVGYASQKHIGTVGAKLYYQDNTIQHGGMVMGVHGVAGHAYLNYKRDFGGYFGKLKAPSNYGGNTAACLMVSRKKYDEVHGLDEKLSVNFNDVDFNLKLTDKGYYNVFLPQVELYHYESKSRGLDITKEKYEKTQKEATYIRTKWKDKLLHDPFYNKNYSVNEVYMLEK